jgi:hypothetical protein
MLFIIEPIGSLNTPVGLLRLADSGSTTHCIT